MGWSYYGERCFEFLFGVKGMNGYRIVFVVMVLLGVFLKLEVVWIIVDIVNGFMVIFNFIVLFVLLFIIVFEIKKYFEYINFLEN